MKLKITDIPEEGLEISEKTPESSKAEPWLADLVQEVFQERFPKGNAALLEIRLLKTCENVTLSGDAEIDLTPLCDRCLEKYEDHLSIPLQLNMVPAHKGDSLGSEGEEETELSGEDVGFGFYQGEEIDLDEIIKEMLTLEVPFRFLCDNTCKGLCPRCGQNLNVKSCSCSPPKGDPRFAKLKDILTNK